MARWLEDEGEDAGGAGGDDGDEGVEAAPPEGHGAPLGPGGLHGQLGLVEVLGVEVAGQLAPEGLEEERQVVLEGLWLGEEDEARLVLGDEVIEAVEIPVEAFNVPCNDSCDQCLIFQLRGRKGGRGIVIGCINGN